MERNLFVLDTTWSWLNQGTFPSGAQSWFKDDSIYALIARPFSAHDLRGPGHLEWEHATCWSDHFSSSNERNLLLTNKCYFHKRCGRIWCMEGENTFYGQKHLAEVSHIPSDALINSQTISQQTCWTISWVTHYSPVAQWQFRSSFRFVIQTTRWSSSFEWIAAMMKSNLLLLCFVVQISANNVILSTGNYR